MKLKWGWIIIKNLTVKGVCSLCNLDTAALLTVVKPSQQGTCTAHYYAYSFTAPVSLHCSPPPPPPCCLGPTSFFLSFPYPGAEATSLPSPLPTDWHAAVLCWLVGHPEQSLPALSYSASPCRLPAGPVHGPLWCGRQAALCHRPIVSALSQ